MHLSRILAVLTVALFGLGMAPGEPRVATATEQLITVGGSLQAAIEAARPGDTLLLEARAYNEQLEIAISGTAQAPITIRGAGADVSVINGSVTVEGSAIVLEDLTVDVGGADGDGVDLKAPARDITLRRVHLQNGAGHGVRVGNGVAGVLIEQCTINNFDAGTQDAHGVGIMTASDITIRGCEIFGNSGDAIQVNTPDYPGYNRFATNIRIEGNRLHNNRENALDVKSADGVIFHGNLAWGYRAVDSSDGMAVQVQYGARNVVLSANQIWDSVEGIEVSRGVKSGTNYPVAPSNILIAGNLIRAIVDDPAGDSASGSGIVVRSSSKVRVYNNTVLGVAGAGLYVGVSNTGEMPDGLDVRNNLFEGSANDLRISSPEEAAGLVVDYNHYANGRVNDEPLAEWLAAGYEGQATSGDPRLDAGWRPVPGSPLLDSGTPVGLSYEGAAPDRGWGELGGEPAPLADDPPPNYQHRIHLPLLRKR